MLRFGRKFYDPVQWSSQCMHLRIPLSEQLCRETDLVTESTHQTRIELRAGRPAGNLGEFVEEKILSLTSVRLE